MTIELVTQRLKCLAAYKRFLERRYELQCKEHLDAFYTPEKIAAQKKVILQSDVDKARNNIVLLNHIIEIVRIGNETLKANGVLDADYLDYPTTEDLHKAHQKAIVAIVDYLESVGYHRDSMETAYIKGVLDKWYSSKAEDYNERMNNG